MYQIFILFFFHANIILRKVVDVHVYEPNKQESKQNKVLNQEIEDPQRPKVVQYQSFHELRYNERYKNSN